jgi:hypothetical protein
LSELLGPKGLAFDNDEVLDVQDDEDLKNDPVSQMDMQVSGSGCRVMVCGSTENGIIRLI